MCAEGLRRPALSVLSAMLCLAFGTAASAQTRPPDQPTFRLDPGVFTGGDDAWQRVDFAQRSQPDRDRSLFRDIAGDFGRFFTTRENYAIMAMGLGGSLSFRPLDQTLANSPFNTEVGPHDDAALDRAFEPGQVLGGMAMQVGGALATYGIGAWLDKPGMAEFGRDLFRAQVLTQSITHVMKRSVRRMRPDESNLKSFPSGHTSGAFAAATVFQRHYGWKAGLPAFSVATYIAASRISENKHYLSDLVFGAALGVAAGRTVTFSTGRTQFALAPLVAPGGGGVHVTISRDR